MQLDNTSGALIIVENGSMTLGTSVSIARTLNSDSTGYGNLRLGGSGTTGTVNIANGKTLTSGGDGVSFTALGDTSSISGSGGGEVSVWNKNQTFQNVQIDLTANARGINADMTGSVLNIGGTGAYTLDKDNNKARTMAALNINNNGATVTAYKNVTLTDDSEFKGAYTINTAGDSLTIGKTVTLSGSGAIYSAATNPGVTISAPSKPAAQSGPGLVEAAALDGEATEVTNVVITDSSITGGAKGGTISNAQIGIAGADRTISGVTLDNTIISLAENSSLALEDVTFGTGSGVQMAAGSEVSRNVTGSSITATSVTGAGDERAVSVTLSSGVLGGLSSLDAGATLTLNLDQSFLTTLTAAQYGADTNKLILTFAGMDTATGLFSGTEGATISNVVVTAPAPYGAGEAVAVSYGSTANQIVVELNAAIPEPATGTLSVLALAALAARRRRKH